MKGLKFQEHSGNVDFFYKEPCRDGGYYEINETVPAQIAKQGEKAILSYASRKINEAKMGWRKWEFVEDNIRKNHIPIQGIYKDGTPLEGRIIKATGRYIGVKLDKPLRGEDGINFGFASANAGHYVFAKDYKISQYGFNAARQALCTAYEHALHKPERGLVGRLNQMTKKR